MSHLPHEVVVRSLQQPNDMNLITGAMLRLGWGLTALSTQFRSYHAFKVKTIL